MPTIGPLDSLEAREVRRLAQEHGCKFTETVTGRWWWKAWTFTIPSPTSDLQRALAELQSDESWWRAIK